MREYVSPSVIELQFHTDEILTFSIDNPGIETPTIPYNLPKIDLSGETK